jgi:Chaperone of endosialidase
MKSYVFALVALAAIGLSGAAFAGEATHPGKATGPVAMSDSEMDKVTAGLFIILHGPPGDKFVIAPALPNFPLQSKPFSGKADNAAKIGLSDMRLKQDIIQVARLDNGLGLYRYRYKWSNQAYVGVMAQEVELVRPDAVVRGADGYLRVDYSRLGLHLMTWQEWVASRPFKTAENGTATAPKAMSNSEMDKVTAAGLPSGKGEGTLTACCSQFLNHTQSNNANPPKNQDLSVGIGTNPLADHGNENRPL